MKVLGVEITGEPILAADGMVTSVKQDGRVEARFTCLRCGTSLAVARDDARADIEAIKQRAIDAAEATGWNGALCGACSVDPDSTLVPG